MDSDADPFAVLVDCRDHVVAVGRAHIEHLLLETCRERVANGRGRGAPGVPGNAFGDAHRVTQLADEASMEGVRPLPFARRSPAWPMV